MLTRPQGSQLAGTETPLASVVATAGTREEQARRVDAYWTLTSAVADYYLGLAEVRELSRLKQRQSTFSTTLNSVESTLATRVDTSLKAARAAQHRLARLTGTGVMPLPSDTPFTGPYATRFERAFPAGGPEEARLLHELLPLRLAELQDAADRIASAQAWVDRVAGESGARSNGDGVVMALELLALNRRAFVMIVRDYNLRISRYTQLVTPERVDTGRLVAMLIRTPGGGVRSADDSLMAGFSAGAPGESTNSANRGFSSGAPSRR